MCCSRELTVVTVRWWNGKIMTCESCSALAESLWIRIEKNLNQQRENLKGWMEMQLMSGRLLAPAQNTGDARLELRAGEHLAAWSTVPAEKVQVQEGWILFACRLTLASAAVSLMEDAGVAALEKLQLHINNNPPVPFKVLHMEPPDMKNQYVFVVLGSPTLNNEPSPSVLRNAAQLLREAL
jgi:hypothetical protein